MIDLLVITNHIIRCNPSGKYILLASWLDPITCVPKCVIIKELSLCPRDLYTNLIHESIVKSISKIHFFQHHGGYQIAAIKVIWDNIQSIECEYCDQFSRYLYRKFCAYSCESYPCYWNYNWLCIFCLIASYHATSPSNCTYSISIDSYRAIYKSFLYGM